MADNFENNLQNFGTFNENMRKISMNSRGYSNNIVKQIRDRHNLSYKRQDQERKILRRATQRDREFNLQYELSRSLSSGPEDDEVKSDTQDNKNKFEI